MVGNTLSYISVERGSSGIFWGFKVRPGSNIFIMLSIYYYCAPAGAYVSLREEVPPSEGHIGSVFYFFDGNSRGGILIFYFDIVLV